MAGAGGRADWAVPNRQGADVLTRGGLVTAILAALRQIGGLAVLRRSRRGSDGRAAHLARPGKLHRGKHNDEKQYDPAQQGHGGKLGRDGLAGNGDAPRAIVAALPLGGM